MKCHIFFNLTVQLSLIVEDYAIRYKYINMIISILCNSKIEMDAETLRKQMDQIER